MCVSRQYRIPEACARGIGGVCERSDAAQDSATSSRGDEPSERELITLAKEMADGAAESRQSRHGRDRVRSVTEAVRHFSMRKLSVILLHDYHVITT